MNPSETPDEEAQHTDTEPPGNSPDGSTKPPVSTPGRLPNKPCIMVVPGQLHRAVAEAEAVLAATGRYFMSAGAIVRIIDRGDQGVATEQVHEQTLKTVLSGMIEWQRKNRDRELVMCDPPYAVIQALLHSQDRYHLQALNGIARQPFYGADGQLVVTPGFDPVSGVFGSFNASDYLLSSPDVDGAKRALAYLLWHLDEFEFESDAHRAAAVCAMLTAAVRASLPVAPAWSFTASDPGSGKTCLSDVISYFAGPEEPHRVSYPARADEAGKLVVSVLMEKPAVVSFDDMQTNWKSLGPLNRALTSASTTERLLGTNRTATVPTRTLFLGNGNNIEPERDMRRRVITVRLAPKAARPAFRTFNGDPVAYVRKNRARMVSCALTIIRAFQAAGEPDQDGPPIGTFGEWSRYCRDPLKWLGLPDPAQRLIDQVSHDPERERLSDFLELWHRHLGSRSITVRKLIAKAEQHQELMEALEDLPVFDGRPVNPNQLGWYLRKVRGQRANGLRVEPGDSSERRSWRLADD